MDTSPTRRPLTYDEQRASEAAFLGHPTNPSWTQGAQRIYDQLTQALTKKQPKAKLPYDGGRLLLSSGGKIMHASWLRSPPRAMGPSPLPAVYDADPARAADFAAQYGTRPPAI